MQKYPYVFCPGWGERGAPIRDRQVLLSRVWAASAYSGARAGHASFHAAFAEHEVVLEGDLVRGGFRVERQKAIGFEFEGLHFENAFVLDLLVDRASPPPSAPPRAPREMTPASYFFILQPLRTLHHMQVYL
jgi:hypothetical protein